MEFNKNKLINDTIDAYATTWSHTLDTEDYIDKKFLQKIDKYIYKNLKKKFAEIEVFHLLYLQDKGIKLSWFQKLKISFSGLKPLYLAEKEKQRKQAELEEQKRLERLELLKKKKRKSKKKD